MKAIRAVLSEQIDFTGNVVSHDIIEKIVTQVTPLSNDKFRWTFNLLGDSFSVAAYLKGRKNNPSFRGGSAKDISFNLGSTGSYQRKGDKVKPHFYYLMTLIATEDDARDYFSHHPEYGFPKGFEDIVFDVYI